MLQHESYTGEVYVDCEKEMLDEPMVVGLSHAHPYLGTIAADFKQGSTNAAEDCRSVCRGRRRTRAAVQPHPGGSLLGEGLREGMLLRFCTERRRGPLDQRATVPGGAGVRVSGLRFGPLPIDYIGVSSLYRIVA